MTNTEDAIPTGSPVDSAPGPELQESNRASSRPPRVYPTRSGGIGASVRAAVPPTRRFIRRHPYAGLLGAALLGVWLVRGKPLRALTRSLVLGLAARRYLTALPSGVLGRLRPAPPSGGKPNRPL